MGGCAAISSCRLLYPQFMSHIKKTRESENDQPRVDGQDQGDQSAGDDASRKLEELFK
jgi:hypothetical protein